MITSSILMFEFPKAVGFFCQLFSVSDVEFSASDRHDRHAAKTRNTNYHRKGHKFQSCVS